MRFESLDRRIMMRLPAEEFDDIQDLFAVILAKEYHSSLSKDFIRNTLQRMKICLL